MTAPGEEGYYVKDALLLLREKDGPDLRFILGILNSQLMSFLYSKSFTTLSVAKNAILTLPIWPPGFSDAGERAKHDTTLRLVGKMSHLHKRLQKARTVHDEELIQRQIDAMDREIDRLVYDLYGLTEKEIKIVEEAAI